LRTGNLGQGGGGKGGAGGIKKSPTEIRISVGEKEGDPRRTSEKSLAALGGDITSGREKSIE